MPRSPLREQGAVIGETVPDDLVAEQLEEPEVLERGGEEPGDRVSLSGSQEAKGGQDQKDGEELAPHGAAPAVRFGAPTVGRRRRRCPAASEARRPVWALSVRPCRLLETLSRLSSFWSYCLAMVGNALIAISHLGEQVLHDVVGLDRSPARHRRRELAHRCGLEVGGEVRRQA